MGHWQLVLWTLLSFRGSEAQRAAARPPNLVVITVDTLRADRLGCYGYKLIKTPRIDALAADGILVEKAYSSHPSDAARPRLPFHRDLSGVSRCARLHGRHPRQGTDNPRDHAQIGRLQDRGDRGFGGPRGPLGHQSGFRLLLRQLPSPVDPELAADRRTAGRRGSAGIARLAGEDTGKAPFFLWVHLYDPHDPYTPPPPYDRQYAARPYDGEVAYTDENVGRIIDALKQRGLYDNSLIVLLSDHGESLGEHGEKTHGFFIYDSTLRIPLIFKLPGTAGPRARRIAGPVRIVDVIPTALGRSGALGQGARAGGAGQERVRRAAGQSLRCRD